MHHDHYEQKRDEIERKRERGKREREMRERMRKRGKRRERDIVIVDMLCRRTRCKIRPLSKNRNMSKPLFSPLTFIHDRRTAMANVITPDYHCLHDRIDYLYITAALLKMGRLPKSRHLQHFIIGGN